MRQFAKKAEELYMMLRFGESLTKAEVGEVSDIVRELVAQDEMHARILNIARGTW
jgi:hypothetical protein